MPFDGAAAHLLITLDGSDPARIAADYERIGEICLANKANDVLVADNVQLRDRLWEARKKLIEAVKHMSPQKIMDTQDVVVPRTQLPELLPRIREVGERYLGRGNPRTGCARIRCPDCHGEHLLTFAAAKPPPAHVFEQVALMAAASQYSWRRIVGSMSAAEERTDYFSDL